MQEMRHNLLLLLILVCCGYLVPLATGKPRKRIGNSESPKPCRIQSVGTQLRFAVLYQVATMSVAGNAHLETTICPLQDIVLI
ncbi:hypothetical protein OS493_001776 [Desmophyllum pertusum]|uniref:Secreted protein n=1 Tax=Desmophyllum pertusum TaxID=174260 RepID=A0A9X0CTJ2_9CNID|nr:hypothetical protein OS493_001776 [Desmophyllum pertusum]